MAIQFQYSTTIVNLDGSVIAQLNDQKDDNMEIYKTATGKTVATYETSPQQKKFQLQCRMKKDKLTELNSFWSLVNGTEKTFVFTDKDSVTHNVKWDDAHFPIIQQDFNMAEGTINLIEI
ncbi:MAG: hypothetical protein HY096_00290 [Nitrospinae bacterium]|nr:hypothetical protein [Nitrospinota bacterium]